MDDQRDYAEEAANKRDARREALSKAHSEHDVIVAGCPHGACGEHFRLEGDWRRDPDAFDPHVYQRRFRLGEFPQLWFVARGYPGHCMSIVPRFGNRNGLTVGMAAWDDWPAADRVALAYTDRVIGYAAGTVVVDDAGRQWLNVWGALGDGHEAVFFPSRAQAESRAESINIRQGPNYPHVTVRRVEYVSDIAYRVLGE